MSKFRGDQNSGKKILNWCANYTCNYPRNGIETRDKWGLESCLGDAILSCLCSAALTNQQYVRMKIGLALALININTVIKLISSISKPAPTMELYIILKRTAQAEP